MNIEWNEWGYGPSSYFRLILNELKVMSGPISIYTPLRL
jgi:hypothetical protein